MLSLGRIGALVTSRPLLIALVLGALAACGFEPLALWPLTLLAIAGLIQLIATAPTWRMAALCGWLFGVGHFTVGNTWIATAFTYQAQMPGWLGWIAVVLLALYLAVYPALAVMAAWLLARRSSLPALVLAFAGCWAVSEWLRGWVFTGFAWNPLAMAALGPFGRPGLAALAPWLGTYALSAVVVLLAGLWLAALRRWRADWRTAAAAAIPVVALLLPTHGSDGQGTLRYTLVQPDIRQEVLDDPAQYENQFIKTARLTLPRDPGVRRIVLWPESGVPDYLREGYPGYFYRQTTYLADPLAARRRIGAVAGPNSLVLTGAVDLEMDRGDVVGARNAVTVIDGAGRIVGGYFKAHLVPYGEYLPMRWLLEPLGLSRLVPGALDFLPGPGPRTLDLGAWGKAGVQICYEIVFSGQVVDPDQRPDYIFNPSNDGWFGSWGPPQHLAQARLRAIEEGLPVLRVTTTGISAVIDADGVVRQHVPRHRAERLDGLVPPAHPPTPFARLGNWLAMGWALVLIAASLGARLMTRNGLDRPQEPAGGRVMGLDPSCQPPPRGVDARHS
jgi:apolipoprotein N-acyltransferase